MALRQTAQWAIYRAASPRLRRALTVQSAHELWRAVNVHPELKYVYMSNAKVASTTIKTLLIEDIRGAGGDASSSPHKLSSGPFHRLTDVSRIRPLERLIARGTPFVAMVRNPYARLVSAYEGIIRRPTTKVKRVGGFVVAPNAEPVSFETFVTRICRADDAAMDNHWRVQVSNLSMESIPYTFVGHLENPDDLKRLLTACGCDDANIRRRNPSVADAVVSDYFTDRLAAIVRARYSADFELLRYSTDPREQKPIAPWTA